MRDRNPDLSDLALGELVIRVVAGLGREVECDGKAGLTLAQVLAIERIRFRCGRVTRVGPKDPGLVALASRARLFAHPADPPISNPVCNAECSGSVPASPPHASPEASAQKIGRASCREREQI